MTEQERANEVVARLHQAYPDAKCSLDFTTPLELLVATILAAQCTDDRVNMVTRTLFQKYKSAQDYTAVPLSELEQDLKQINFYRNKAKNVQAMATILVQRYHGEVPKTMRELVALPGAARKTANVVLGNAFGIVEGVIVDTHCNRISNRLGFVTSDDPVVIEQQLMKIVDRKDWLDYTHLLIYHGRAICQARKPLCQQCTLLDLCPTGAANVAAAAATPAPATKAKGKAKAASSTPAASS
ncbi:MAG TPA: endonuclease III [Ktedonobacterales bacterium]|nr:endonuclease III [Ktedonobacterales bacterium]